MLLLRDACRCVRGWGEWREAARRVRGGPGGGKVGVGVFRQHPTQRFQGTRRWASL